MRGSISIQMSSPAAMKPFLLASAAILFSVAAQAQPQPQAANPVQLFANQYPVGPGNPLPTAFIAATTPIALTPTTIVTTGTYQQAFAAGAAITTGGVLQAPASNAAAICLDMSKTAAAGLTTPTGGQVCAQPGTAISFPATAGAGFVYGNAGDKLSGNAS